MDQKLNILLTADGSQLVRTISEVEQELKDLEQQLKSTKSADTFVEISNKIKKTKVDLDTLNNTAKRTLTGVSNSAGGATVAMTNLGRVVQDAPYGFIGIANNLNPLLESFQRLKVETGSTGGALKSLGSSLMGAGGLGLALSAVTAIFSFAQIGFSSWTRGSKDAEKATTEFEDSLERVNKLVKETSGSFKDRSSIAAGSVVEEIEKTKILASVIADTNRSYEERNRALTSLQSINKVYFGDITLEINGLKNLTAAVNDYANALTATEVTKAFASDLGKLSVELNKQLVSYKKLGEEVDKANVTLGATTRITGSGLASGVEVESAYTRAASAVSDLTIKYHEQGEVVKKLLIEQQNTRKGLNEAINVELTFKPLVDTKKDTTSIKNKIAKDVKMVIEDAVKIIAADPVPLSIQDALVFDGVLSTQKLFANRFKEDVSKKPDEFLQSLRVWGDQRKEAEKLSATISGLLTPAFDGLVDAIRSGESPLKAFFNGILDSISKVIKRLIEAAIQAVALSLITGGAGAGGGVSFIGALGSILGIGKKGGVAAPSVFGGGMRAAPSLVATVRGTDLNFILQQGSNSIGRIG